MPPVLPKPRERQQGRRVPDRLHNPREFLALSQEDQSPMSPRPTRGDCAQSPGQGPRTGGSQAEAL